MNTPTIPSSLTRVAERFAARLPSKISLMEEAASALTGNVQADDVATIERALHDIVGVASTLGFAPLGDAARRAEDIARTLRNATAEDSGASVEALQAGIQELRKLPPLGDDA
ncbi:Hpt domain-containing protein [Novosphingobium beihaiensis]|uniref:Hpt domain-containing protein n=1 Tax=Novosphingobium beihaiensis TaxID=2930389 RepID=UPI002E1273AC